MKKIIITIIAIATMMTLVSCGESKTTITSHEIGDDTTTVTTWDDATGEESTETITITHTMSDAEYEWLLEQYNEGNIELDVLEEYLFTGHVTKY